jgi:multiple sugar transport system permease protein
LAVRADIFELQDKVASSVAGVMAVVAIYALLLAWNDYLYQAVLLSVRNMTVSVTQGQLFTDNDAPWNAMMAAAIIYVLPPLAILFALRRYVAASLTTVSSGV